MPPSGEHLFKKKAVRHADFFPREVKTMKDTGSIVTFVIVSFALALILIMKKDTLPMPMRRGLAILALVMVSLSFFLILYSFLSL